MAGARDHIPHPQRKARRSLSKIDRTASVQRVSKTADVILAVQGDSAARRNESGCLCLTVVREDHQGAQSKAPTEWEPIHGCVSRSHAEIGGDVGPLVLEGCAVAKEVRARANI